MLKCLNSPYESMNSGYENIPNGANAKLLIRHAHRPSLKGVNSPDNISITKQGNLNAYELGSSITMRIGVCISSPIRRCVETLDVLTKPHTQPLFISNLLGYSFVENIETATHKLSQQGLKETVFQMSLSKQDGFIDANEGIGQILDLIFSAGGNQGQLDIFCTHDMQLALMDLLFYNQYKNSQELKENWPGMLEGMWFWGERLNFYVCWRGKIKHFVNNLERSL